MMELSDDLTETLSEISSESVDFPSFGRVGLKSDAKRDVFVLRDILKQENTFQGIINSLKEKTQLSRPSRKTDRSYRSCKNMLVAAEVLGWSQEMRYEMRNFLNDPDIKSSIEQWRLKIARGEDRPALDICRPLPKKMSMNTFKQFIGYYDTDRFTFNTGVLVVLHLLFGPDPKA